MFVHINYCEHSDKTSGANKTPNVTKITFSQLRNLIIGQVWDAPKNTKDMLSTLNNIFHTVYNTNGQPNFLQGIKTYILYLGGL